MPLYQSGEKSLCCSFQKIPAFLEVTVNALFSISILTLKKRHRCDNKCLIRKEAILHVFHAQTEWVGEKREAEQGMLHLFHISYVQCYFLRIFQVIALSNRPKGINFNHLRYKLCCSKQMTSH